MTMLIEVDAGQSGEAHVFLTKDNNLTAKVPLRRSILQCNLQQKYRSTGKHNPQRDDGPEKGLYRLRPIALALALGQLDAALSCHPPLPVWTFWDQLDTARRHAE